MNENLNNESGNIGDIFNLQPDSFINPKKTKKVEIYSPQADNGKDGVYKALIRFLPNVKNPNASKLQKFYVWIEDPVTGESYSVDCPSTVGKKSILKDTYWQLKNSTSAREQELSQKFSRTDNYYSLVQIVKDQNNPELEGKVMIFKFGSKVNAKIEAQLKPEYGAPCNPFDLFEGKLFALHVVKKLKWNNFDECQFVGEKLALSIEGKQIEKNKEDMAMVVEWLKTNSPELEKYEYREWTDEMYNKVLQSIKNIVPDVRIAEQVMASASNTGAKSTESSYDAEPKYATAQDDVTKAAVDSILNTAPEKKAEKKAASQVNNLDDLYAGL